MFILTLEIIFRRNPVLFFSVFVQFVAFTWA